MFVGKRAKAGAPDYLLLDLDDPAAVQLREFMTRSFGRVQFRSLEQVRDLFDGLELVAPGLVRVPGWRPGEEDACAAEERLTALGLACAGVARRPDGPVSAHGLKIPGRPATLSRKPAGLYR